ncbi:MAG: mechanosensitive ion channel [Bacteroidales bacterium]|nr:mechanosensitive ion channel [Bacteroidales bacterium]
MIEKFSHWLTDLLIEGGLSQSPAESLTDFFVLIFALILSFILDVVIRKVGNSILRRTIRMSKTNWDDILFQNRFFKRVYHLIPVFLFLSVSDKLFVHAIHWNSLITGAVQIYLVVLLVLIINSFLRSVNDIYLTYEGSKNRPIKGYIQTIQIVIISFAVIVIVSVFLGRSPLVILGGLGAFAAVLMLIFRDSILGFVAGIQISFNDMVRLGDWITMSKFGADGVVTDIALTTVKVQNWDKTISTIPAYSIISESFQNWRGMEESGGRRIKRSVFIDMNSIKFADQQMLSKYAKFQLIKDYIETKEVELKMYNEENGVDATVEVNGRRQTNIGVFRAYLNAYLKAKKEIHHTMTFLVRQLQPTEKGLPIEIYVFSKVQEWGAYENIQADIFDHVLAVIPHFDLAIFQNPSGKDIRERLNA